MNKDTENTETFVYDPKESVLEVCGDVTVELKTEPRMKITVEDIIKAAADWHDERYPSSYGFHGIESEMWLLMDRIVREVKHDEKSD